MRERMVSLVSFQRRAFADRFQKFPLPRGDAVLRRDAIDLFVGCARLVDGDSSPPRGCAASAQRRRMHVHGDAVATVRVTISSGGPLSVGSAPQHSAPLHACAGCSRDSVSLRPHDRRLRRSVGRYHRGPAAASCTPLSAVAVPPSRSHVRCSRMLCRRRCRQPERGAGVVVMSLSCTQSRGRHLRGHITDFAFAAPRIILGADGHRRGRAHFAHPSSGPVAIPIFVAARGVLGGQARTRGNRLSTMRASAARRWCCR